MKTLKNHTLIYDEDCPLCKGYTKAFQLTGMLDENGRKSYSKLSSYDEIIVDTIKAKDEIALINYNNRSVIYGVDSLIKIIGNRFPVLNRFLKMSLIHFLLKRLYAFVSYNRKVIIPDTNNPGNITKCVPHFNFKYRIFYILFTALITIPALTLFSSNLKGFVAESNFIVESLVFIGQFIFQWIFLFKQNRMSITSYFGNLATVSLIGALLLLPLIVMNSVLTIAIVPNVLYFCFVVILMFFEHKRRVNLLKLPKHLSFTWIIYRFIILIILLWIA